MTGEMEMMGRGRSENEDGMNVEEGMPRVWKKCLDLVSGLREEIRDCWLGRRETIDG